MCDHDHRSIVKDFVTHKAATKCETLVNKPTSKVYGHLSQT
jgi:hypothetical protein